MKSKLIFTLSIIVFISGCATTLTESGTKVRLVQDQSDHDCTFVATVTGSNSMGNSTAHDAEGAMNQLRNKAADLGANAVRVISVSTTEAVTTTVGEALNCKF
ncbi:MAG: DUF4156 domain-containing protein [Oceanicoccus sp.]